MSLRVVFMGTPEFAAESLKSIVEDGHEVLAVVAQPDKPKGRGMKLVAPPVKEYACCKGFKVLQPQSIRNDEFTKLLKDMNPDVIVVVAYGRILPKAVLDIPKYGCINVHASLLPKYRGAAPIQWAIINGEKETGVTTMFMDEGLDTGDMILKGKVEIDNEDTAQTLHDKLAGVGGKVLSETLSLLEKGDVMRTRQTGESSYAPILKKQDGVIDWSKSAGEICSLVRGMNPWPGAYTYNESGCMLKIWKTEAVDTKSSVEPGQIISAGHKEGLFVSTGSGVLKILELQAECCKRMGAAEFLIGSKIKPGEKFTMGRNSNE